MNRLIPSLLLSCALAGCGADVASTAATEATLTAQQAKQAQLLEHQVRSQMNAAMQAEQTRLQQVEKASNP
jgi:outer membrane PBP1 activator LpoA protein